LDGNWAAGRDGELPAGPAISQVSVEQSGIATAAGLADTTKASPDRRDAVWSQDRIPGGFVKNLIPFVYDLHVLGFSNRSVGIGRRAVASHAGKRDAIEVEKRAWHIGRHHIADGDGRLLDDGVSAVLVAVR